MCWRGLPMFFWRGVVSTWPLLGLGGNWQWRHVGFYPVSAPCVNVEVSEGCFFPIHVWYIYIYIYHKNQPFMEVNKPYMDCMDDNFFRWLCRFITPKHLLRRRLLGFPDSQRSSPGMTKEEFGCLGVATLSIASWFQHEASNYIHIWVFPKTGVPPKHSKMIMFSRKTHGCWVAPF